jgi:glutamate/aspartate transport system substrate-binding protein
MTRKSRVLGGIRRFCGIAIGRPQAGVPLSYLGPGGQPMGCSFELCRGLASAMKTGLGIEDVPANWLPVNPETRLAAIISGEVQLDRGAINPKLGRRKLADFSPTIVVNGTKLLAKADSGVAETPRDAVVLRAPRGFA